MRHTDLDIPLSIILIIVFFAYASAHYPQSITNTPLPLIGAYMLMGYLTRCCLKSFTNHDKD